MTANQRRRDELKNDVKQLEEEGLLLRGQLKALVERLQNEATEAQTLTQEEQALIKEWQEVCASLNVSLNIQDDIAAWLDEQEQYDRQLYQHSQRQAFQIQLNDLEQQTLQIQQ